MAKIIFFLIFFAFPVSVWAGGTTCAGSSIHYVSMSNDFGTPPPQGIKTGEKFLSFKGNLLAKIEHYEGLPDLGCFNYNVALTDEITLATEPNPSYGWRVFEAKLSATDVEKNISFLDQVICKTTWAIVP